MMRSIHLLSDLYKHKTGIDILGLQEDFIGSQLEKRMKQLGINEMPVFIDLLDQNQEEIDVLSDLLFIHHTQFFRNPFVFEFLYYHVYPLLFTKKISISEPLRIWSSGCSTGEEAYSIAIQLKELVEQMNISVPLTIIATDVNSNVLQKAKIGAYDAFSIENIKFKYLLKYFKKNKDIYNLKPSTKQLVEFENYDMINHKTTSPPSSIFGGFDIIFLRNVLIYFNEEEQKNAIRKAYQNLKDGGLLILGNTENILNVSDFNFKRLNSFTPIYRKN